MSTATKAKTRSRTTNLTNRPTIENMKKHYRIIDERKKRIAQIYNIEPPMKLSGITAPFVEALYKVAGKNNELTKVEKDVEELAKYLREPRNKRKLATSAVPESKKLQDIIAALDSFDASPTLKKFAAALSKQKSLPKLSEILNGFAKMMSAHRKETNATVTSAKALSPAQLQKVIKQVQRKVPSDQRVLLKTMSDPKLVQGYVLRVGSTVIDKSYKGEYQRIVDSMKQASRVLAKKRQEEWQRKVWMYPTK